MSNVGAIDEAVENTVLHETGHHLLYRFQELAGAGELWHHAPTRAAPSVGTVESVVCDRCEGGFVLWRRPAVLHEGFAVVSGGLVPRRPLRSTMSRFLESRRVRRRWESKPGAEGARPKHWRRYFEQLEAYRAQGAVAPEEDLYPCLFDATKKTSFDKHYLYQGAWATDLLLREKPDRHVDVGSQLIWVAQVACFVPVTFIDIRPAALEVPGFEGREGTIVNLPFGDGEVRSLSCLHVIEHIGLGRYGDPLDPHGSVRAAAELQRALAPGGRLLLSTPVGRTRTCFNAHRITAPSEVIGWFPELTLESFGAVDDEGHFHPRAEPRDYEAAKYACGLFAFRRRGEQA